MSICHAEGCAETCHDGLEDTSDASVPVTGYRAATQWVRSKRADEKVEELEHRRSQH